jgi:hypothetical protein
MVFYYLTIQQLPDAGWFPPCLLPASCLSCEFIPLIIELNDMESEGGCEFESPRPGCAATVTPAEGEGTVAATTFLAGSACSGPETPKPAALPCSPCIPVPLVLVPMVGITDASEVPGNAGVSNRLEST